MFQFRCTIHRKIRRNVFGVMYIENSRLCIFRDRCMRPNPHGQVSLKMQNIELVFDVSVLSDFKRRKFDGRMDLKSNFKMDITSNKLGHFSF